VPDHIKSYCRKCKAETTWAVTKLWNQLETELPNGERISESEIRYTCVSCGKETVVYEEE
jgi:ribosomal protein L44E